MAGPGGARKGAGRKSNAYKMLQAGFVAPWWTAEVQAEKWKSLLSSNDEKIVLDTAKYLTDRLFGRAAQQVDLNHSGEVDIKRVIADL